MVLKSIHSIKDDPEREDLDSVVVVKGPRPWGFIALFPCAVPRSSAFRSSICEGRGRVPWGGALSLLLPFIPEYLITSLYYTIYL